MLNYIRRLLLRWTIKGVEEYALEVKLWKANIPTMYAMSKLVSDNIDLFDQRQFIKVHSQTEFRSNFAGIDDMIQWIAVLRTMIKAILDDDLQANDPRLNIHNLTLEDVRLVNFVCDSEGYEFNIKEKVLKLARDIKGINDLILSVPESRQAFIYTRAQHGISTVLIFHDLLIGVIAYGK